MKDLTRLLALPATLLCLTLTHSVDAHEQVSWPYNLPRTLKYYPEDEAHVKRQAEVRDRLAVQAPVGLRKMGHDPGEKFYLDYWEFGALPAAAMQNGDEVVGEENGFRRPAVCEETGYANDTGVCSLLSPLASHSNHDRSFLSRLFGRGLVVRDFQCPAGTNSCSNIGSDLCCDNGETCVTLSGMVGCCPNGATCGGSIAGCDTASGYTSCPNSANGGCCIPGAKCLDEGCVIYGTQTVTTRLPTVTVTSGVSTFTPSRSESSEATVVVLTSVFTITQTISEPGTTVISTVVSPTTIIISPIHSSSCSAGFFSCPASVGGGCCPNGQACAADNQCPDITFTTSATASPPVRQTSESAVHVAETSTTTIVDGCPTGFYMCSARYLGNCCQVDRDCDTTSCPAPDPTAVLTSSGLTIAAANSDAASCANGWSSCAASVGGGCCPSGYLCETSSCGNTAGGGDQAKQTPTSEAVVLGLVWGFFTMGVAVAVGMVWL